MVIQTTVVCLSHVMAFSIVQVLSSAEPSTVGKRGRALQLLRWEPKTEALQSHMSGVLVMSC